MVVVKAIAIIYQTTDGQTRRISERLAERLKAIGHDVQIENLDQLDPDFSLNEFDQVVIGASIRYGKHRPQVAEFIEQHADVLAEKQSAFFTVNVVARKPEKNSPETNPYLTKWLPTIDHEFDHLGVFAGRLLYPDYGFIDRFMIRLIMKMTKGPTDTRQTYEFTDWDSVDSFAEQLA